MHRGLKTLFLSVFLILCQSDVNALYCQQNQSIFGLQLFKYETWEMMLPNDWKDLSTDSKMLYFESGDKSKGIYYMSLQHNGPSNPDPEKTLQILIQGGQKGLDSMKGYRWQRQTSAKRTSKNGIIRYSEEFLDSEKMYSISTLIFVAPHAAVRITFHDYHCTNIAATRSYFSAPAQSLRIIGITP